MKADDLDFPFPEELIALTPVRPSRVAFIGPKGAPPQELDISALLAQFQIGDLLVINESKVVPARVFSAEEIEVLFLKALDSLTWEVLFPAREFKVGDTLNLPRNLKLTLSEKGLPQKVKLSRPIDSDYFNEVGEVALPPYIQERRGERHNRPEDRQWYQTAWAQQAGSVAAPTASLHFTREHVQQLLDKGVNIARVVLHVGAGTFLPVRANELKDHVMHEEWAEIGSETVQLLHETKSNGKKVWALGTTVTRTLESMAAGLLTRDASGGFLGPTRLFIYPPYEFKVVDALLTNFHQPKSTLFGLVAAFAGLERARHVYAWAIEKRFRLFSYGDLSAWIKP